MSNAHESCCAHLKIQYRTEAVKGEARVSNPNQDQSAYARQTRRLERTAYCLMRMMQAYERRVRSDCKTPEELEKRPWECAEYIEAANLLRGPMY